MTRLRLAFYIALLGLLVKKYGLMAAMTTNRARHAAIGRAKRSWGYLGHHNKAVACSSMPATDLIEYLRRERQIAAFATYGV